MARYDFDLITIGAGSGGLRASRIVAQAGFKVGICEESRVGGTCVIRGCIPKKFLVHAAYFADIFQDSTHFGWNKSQETHNWDSLIQAKNKEIDRLNNLLLESIQNNDIALLRGKGKIQDPHTVEVNGKIYTTERILIATGSWPYLPSINGIEHAITSNEALNLNELPKKIIIVGGGYIAVEFASIFNSLGSNVTEVIRADNILRNFDDSLSSFLQNELTKKGVKILPKTIIEKITKQNDNSYTVFYNNGKIETCNLVMYATGRNPKIDGLGLEKIGIRTLKNGSIDVDTYSRTNIENIWAIGDVTNRKNLTPVAIQEAVAFVNTVFLEKPSAMNYQNIPAAVFSIPPIGTVGLTEKQAQELYPKIDIYQTTFKPLIHNMAKRNEQVIMKLIVQHENRRILGAHMGGINAPEIIQGVAIALKCNATKEQFDSTVAVHPSIAEEFVLMRKHNLIKS